MGRLGSLGSRALLLCCLHTEGNHSTERARCWLKATQLVRCELSDPHGCPGHICGEPRARGETLIRSRASQSNEDCWPDCQISPRELLGHPCPSCPLCSPCNSHREMWSLRFLQRAEDISLEVSPGGSYLLGTSHIPKVGLGVPLLEPAKVSTYAQKHSNLDTQLLARRPWQVTLPLCASVYASVKWDCC